jgi:hypothetical protein
MLPGNANQSRLTAWHQGACDVRALFRKTNPKENAMLKRFTHKGQMLIPTRYNDGSKIPSNVLDKIPMKLCEAFGRYNRNGYSKGSYKMKDGSISKDRSARVWVAMNAEHVGKFKELAGEFAAILEQESLCTEVTVADITIVVPDQA